MKCSECGNFRFRLPHEMVEGDNRSWDRRRGNKGRPTKKSIEDSFWERVKEINGCWEFMGARDVIGYGRFTAPNSKIRLAHRQAMTFIFGELTSSQLVLHRCDNKACVNPKHLYLGTIKENSLDHKKTVYANKVYEKINKGVGEP